ncbi:polyhydroxyalkanoate synthesis repressor PhaR [Paracoccus luteus]|uniref:polyhydroxyalkanoate synthesis repressor PhaR n=1 Tax=Paracoccus luteus TaxID=2508543 RepID=UPI001FE3FFBC|nr:polyhydroxyalkanoate synthesis repressor PhaR [Paracoccus luteus]
MLRMQHTRSAMPADAPAKPLLVKRYASRRLYNTESSDYVTLEEIARVIREGREVRIVDLKSGDDLTRQYLLQIIAEHESRGESVLPVDVLTDLVRSYTAQAQSVVPQFLAASFEMLRDGQSKMLEQFSALQHPIASMPGFAEMQRQQQKFLRAMMAGWGAHGASGPQREEDVPAAPSSDALPAAPRPGSAAQPDTAKPAAGDASMDDIRRQLAELQARIARL